MKLKYYLRGAGVGVIVTTLVLTIAFHAVPEKEGEAESSDTEQALTIAEALSEKEETETNEETIANEENEANVETVVNQEVAVTEKTEPAEEKIVRNEEPAPEAEIPVDAGAAEAAEAKTEVRIVTFRISTGQSPGAVSKGLKDAGIIEDDEAFYQYLVEQGLNNSLEVGEFSIPTGCDFSELAKILTMNDYERKNTPGSAPGQ